ncbi:hypothetical protein CANINC_001952 [Pichia inconspicua]|uniref:Ribosome biogenesis protein NOP53 n=1 Tax=Pichia inconspicua TaxID=52247 RepID=A0A4T0X3N8_9ASCO|nr:hypothetical protein CANINC_001952 [[Candida] inconspicua]
MSDIGRPQNSNQRSKKGRRAWRKNVDISDIEKKLEEQRDDVVHHGKPLSEMENEDLFIIDESEDEDAIKKNNIKKLKSAEILENKSKVPALIKKVEKKSNKVQNVDKKEMIKLLKLAGKIKGVDKTKERMAKEGIINSKAYNVWDTPLEQEIEESKLPSALKENSATSFNKPKHSPSTLKEAPMKIKKYEIIPHAGKSYNPSYDNWKHLIDQEYFKEKPKEDQRLELEEYRDKIQHLISNYEDNEVREDDSDDTDEEQETETVVETEEVDMKLSINPVTKLKIKTKTQRNKEKRNRDRLRLEEELRTIKLRIKELEKLPAILDDVEAKEQKTVIKAQAETKSERKLRKGKKKLGKYEVIEGHIEVKLRDELTDSLRKLKPEGNLLYDQMKKLQSKGMIETRRISKGKKGKTKVSEKWSYKDFK